MHSWPTPYIPEIPAPATATTVTLFDTASQQNVSAGEGDSATLYVCGITPYDSAHLGHAATYVAFDLLVRAWLDAGKDVTYIQNVTDVDDPLLERATRDNVAWSELAAEQINTFRRDMTALGVIPPTHFAGVVEEMEAIALSVSQMLSRGAAYMVATDEAEGDDVYADLSADPHYSTLGGYSGDEAMKLFGERGGDLDRAGKRHPCDPLLWRAARAGEPAWEADGLPKGRPGWHVECSAIAAKYATLPLDVQAGGSDLIFPHHAMSASHARANGADEFAKVYVHAGMVGLEGRKMSKSEGNLVFVRELLDRDIPGPAIRLALLDHKYCADWSFDDGVMKAAMARYESWREAFAQEYGPDATATVQAMRHAIADDLDAPAALKAVDAWADRQAEQSEDRVQGATGVVSRAVDALLGVRF